MKVKYIGKDQTRVRVSESQEKLDVKSGDVFEIESKRANYILTAYKDVFQKVGESEEIKTAVVDVVEAIPKRQGDETALAEEIETAVVKVVKATPKRGK